MFWIRTLRGRIHESAVGQDVGLRSIPGPWFIPKTNDLSHLFYFRPRHGPSPRVRGKPIIRSDALRGHRSIPAHAGETTRR